MSFDIASIVMRGRGEITVTRGVFELHREENQYGAIYILNGTRPAILALVVPNWIVYRRRER